MGYLTRKIDNLSSLLYKQYCIGESKFINKKIIKQEITDIIVSYILSHYQINKNCLINSLTTSNCLIELVDELKKPLFVIKEHNINIDNQIINDNITNDLRNFFVSSNKVIHRNCHSLKNHKKNLFSVLPSEQLSNDLIDELLQTIEIQM